MASISESSSLNSELGGSVPEEKQSSSLQEPTLPPFPRRPCSAFLKSDFIRECTAAVENAPVKKNLHVKTYIPETPSIAPRYRKNGPADYFPWTGTHPEDVLSELTSKQGFYDKVQVSQNESGTARPCIWSSLKHKSGLQILSSLFVSAIDQRQVHRTVSTSCTFKPPPRVTLTDTKREAWLRDLADSQIPLRRLSRTIPHGIRGKALLEHCLVKDIPITRAVWLAKCVGANEIRAFKRKGASGAFTVGGEEKWIKDWTTNVQQFVETVMSECGTLEWRSRMYYCLRLVTYLYSERLLNQDQYLEWITSSLQSCDLDSIPVWLLVAQINWKEILRYRQRGKHLTEAILKQLSKASEPANADAFGSLSEKLIQLLISIMPISPACFILPLCWNQYENMIRNGLEKFGVEMIPELKRLCQRNLQLQKSAVSYVYSSQHVDQQQIIALLDELAPQADLNSIARRWLEKFKDRRLFISTCLSWATSPSRNGSFRVYLAVRLFRLWAKLHVEVEEPLLDFLAVDIVMPPLQKADVYRVLAELVHSKTISVSKYLQRLIAKGSLAACKNRDGLLPTDVQWIFELPIDGLSDHVLNLRQILQASTGSSITQEKEDLAFAKAEISAKIQGFFAQTQVLKPPVAQKCGLIKLSQTNKSALGRWVRHMIASQLSSRRPGTAQYDAFRVANMKGPFILITAEQFGNIRSILETLNEYPILADVIKICCNSIDIMVLTVASETVNYHFEIFSAIGAANNLFQALYDRYEEFCRQAIKPKLLTESLSDLILRLPSSRTERGHLQYRLLVLDHNSALSAYSPISDYISEQLHPSESAFIESVEQSFTSGTLMEEQVLEKVFTKITAELQKSWVGSGDKSVSNLTDLLLRLRGYGVSIFEQLLYQWLDRFFLSTPRPKLRDLMPSFICTGIVTLSAVIERIMIVYGTVESKGHVPSLALEAFELLTLSDLELKPILSHKTYRFYAQQNHTLRELPSLAAAILHATMSTCASRNAITLLKTSRIIPVIQSLSPVHTGESDLIGFALEDNMLLSPVQQAIDWIIYSSDEPEPSDIDIRFRLSKLFLHVTIFNLPLCRLKLRAILMERSQTQSHHDTANILISILRKETIIRGDVVINMWISLFGGVPDIYAFQIHEKAESELLALFSETATASLAHRRRIMQSMIGVINATANGITESGTSETLLQVTEIVNNILATSVVVAGSSYDCEGSHRDFLLRIEDSITNLDILLRLLSIHHSVGLLAKCSESVLVALLLALSNLLLLPSLSAHVDIADYIFDVLTIITDSVTEEICFQCVQVLRSRNHAKDPRLQYIFGYSNKVEGEWLQSVANPQIQSGSRIEDPQQATPARLPYALRRWEMVQEATPLIAENDTSLSLTLFGTREVVF